MKDIIKADHEEALECVNTLMSFVKSYFIKGYDLTELQTIRDAIEDELGAEYE